MVYYIKFTVGGKVLDIQWMGRYRELVAALIQHSNLNARTFKELVPFSQDIALTVTELQVLEVIIESRNIDKMSMISDRLCVPQSSFSKIVSRLCSYDLVQKYQMVGNKKNIILRPTEKAEKLYADFSENYSSKNLFMSFFNDLKDVDDEVINTFTKAICSLNADIIANQKENEVLNSQVSQK